jgi:hypothetical protein
MTEWEALGDTVSVRGVNHRGFAQRTAAFRAFGLAEVSPACAAAQHFAAGGDLESFGHRLFSFDAFGTSHKSISFQKRGRNIGDAHARGKGYFGQ